MGKTQEEFVSQAKLKHGDVYDYSLSRYSGATKKVEIVCSLHGRFEQYAYVHLRGSGCPKCSGGYIGSTEEFLRRAKLIHGDTYDYSDTVFVSGKDTKVQIKCAKHGLFEQRNKNHLEGSGCPKCVGQFETLEEYVTKARKKHGDRFEYLSLERQGSEKHINFVCPDHGQQRMKSHGHLRVSGCSHCGATLSKNAQRRGRDKFIELSNKIHHNRFDYDLVRYHNSFKKVKIQCRDHGVFEQTPASHLQGIGCPRCSHKISKGETAWLDFLGLPQNLRQVSIKLKDKKHPIQVDAYDSVTNTVYEYNGDYWHGNPIVYAPNEINKNNKKTFGELYRSTIDKEEKIKANGYNLITIWEYDWLSQKEMKNAPTDNG
jgi:Zn finger protein HypA/HybF involved in hydrogenase expression